MNAAEALPAAVGRTNDVGLRALMQVKRTERKKGEQQ